MAGRSANVTVSPVACGIRASAAIDARVYVQPFRTPSALRLPSSCVSDTRAQAKLQRASWMAGRRANVTVSPVACGTRASAAIDARVYVQPFRTPSALRLPSSCVS